MSNTTWSESRVTYKRRLAIDGVEVGRFDAAGAGTWLEVDVTTVVTGPGQYSFGVSQTGGDGVGFASRESAESGRRSQLVITTQ